VILLGDATIRAGVFSLLLLAPWVLLVLWVIYVTVFASAVVTDADGITVQNLLRRTRIAWSAVADIDLRYQLVITTVDGRRVTCFGGPVSGRPARGRLAQEQGRRLPPAIKDLDRLLDDLEAARERGAGDGRVTRSWDVPALVAVAVLIVAAVIATFVVTGSTAA